MGSLHFLVEIEKVLKKNPRAKDFIIVGIDRKNDQMELTRAASLAADTYRGIHVEPMMFSEEQAFPLITGEPFNKRDTRIVIHYNQFARA